MTTPNPASLDRAREALHEWRDILVAKEMWNVVAHRTALALDAQIERDGEAMIAYAKRMIEGGFWIKVDPVGFAHELARALREQKG